MSRFVSRRVITAATAALALVASLFAVFGIAASPASADVFDENRPAVQQRTAQNVTAESLPTAQIDSGVVWRQVIRGNTVFAGGEFSNARPAGAAPGTHLIPRANLLAYDITTGALSDTWAPSANGPVNDMALSPDGQWLYITGDFTAVDGISLGKLARISTTTGAVDPDFRAFLGGTGLAVLATDTTVYVGGSFTAANGVTRANFAAFTTTGALTGWAPTSDGRVQSLALLPDGSRLFAAGTFQAVNGSNVYGLTPLDPATGAVVASSFTSKVQAYTSPTARSGAAGFYRVYVDADSVYASAWNYSGGGDFEGTARFTADGEMLWMYNCLGDNYDVVSMNDSVYTVGHPHDCDPINGWPDTNPRQFQRASAFTKSAEGVNGHNVGNVIYRDAHYGEPAPALINWNPDVSTGGYTGQYQAAWDTTGDGRYLLLGGEFPSVNGANQQGIARFALPSIAPSTQRPRPGDDGFAVNATARGNDTARLTWNARADRDDLTLTYQVLRDGSTAPIASFTADATWWNTPTLGYVDSGLVPGSSHTYRIAASDGDGNTTSSPTVSITLPSSGSAGTAYDAAVLADGPTSYWPMNEASGTTAPDSVAFNDLRLGANVTHGAAGPMAGGTADTFDGTSNGSASTTTAVSGPQVFSLSAWVKTTSTGKVVGFGSSQTGNSSNIDRHLYIDKNGKPVFGVRPSSTRTVVTGAGSVNDGNWHLLVGTLGSGGMSLWVDGVRVGYNASVTSAQDYSGYWRVGGDSLSSWSNAGSTYLKGAIAGVAVFGTELTKAQIQAQYQASGRTIAGGGRPADVYGQTVYDDDPSIYWRLDEASGTAVVDASGYNAPGTYNGTVTRGVASPVAGPAGKAVTFNGSNGFASSNASSANPKVYSVEAWFKTNTTRGGIIADFGSAKTGTSTSNNQDRQIAMLDNGKVAFGVRASSVNQTATSTASYNDNAWHHAVATQAGDGMKLYVDGTLVATNAATTALSITGYWRVGGDRAWTGQTSGYFAGTIDEFAQYGYALSPDQVHAHWLASPVSPNVAPSADFATQVEGRTATADAAASADSDGAIVSYDWDFGDGATGTGATASHHYGANGSYVVTLAVTDNDGGTASTTRTVIIDHVSVPPVAQFAVAADGLSATFDATGSTDEDGSIVSYVWDFGDRSPLDPSGAGPTHAFPADGVYPVTLTVTDDDGATGSVTQDVTVSSVAIIAADGFGRVAANGWGVADSGGAWTVSGAASRYGVDGSRGTASVAAGATLMGTLAGVSASDVEVRGEFSLDGAASGKWVQAGLVARRVGTSDYRLKVQLLPTGAVSVIVSKVVSNVETVLGSATIAGLTYVPGESLSARFAVVGDGAGLSALSAAVWPTGQPEPAAQVGAIDGDAALRGAGAVGAYFASSGTSSTQVLTLDGFSVVNPKTQVVRIAPTADFQASVADLGVSLDAGASYQLGGTIASYGWDFGDGSTLDAGDSALADHQYAQGGSYPVTLTVTGDNGLTATAHQTVTVRQAPAAAFALARHGLDVTLDGSASADPDGTIASYGWDFGDGSPADVASGAAASHSYAAAGTYAVTLTVTDNDGLTAAATQEVEVALGAAAAYTASSADVAAQFDASGSSTTSDHIVSYAWDFGDGSPTETVSGPVVSHAYPLVSGDATYTVALTVLDDAGSTASYSAPVTITHVNVGPTAAFASVIDDLSLAVDASASGDLEGPLASYAWEFGDGATASGATASHAYAQPGTYTVRLTVTDADQATSAVTKSVTVIASSAADGFGRVAANGWGVADSGGAWTVSGAASRYGVDGSRGTASVAAGATLMGTLAGVSASDVEVRGEFSLDGAASGKWVQAGLVARRVGTSDYRLKVQLLPTGAVSVIVSKVVSNVETVLGSATIAGLTYVPGESLSARFAVVGDGSGGVLLSGSAWRTGQTEPAAQVSATDADPGLRAAGAVGTYFAASGTSTAQVFTVDNFAALSPADADAARAAAAAVVAAAAPAAPTGAETDAAPSGVDAVEEPAGE